MIKKIIYTIGFLLFLSGPLAPMFSRAVGEDAAPSEACKFSVAPECRLGKSPNKGLDWGSSFGEKDPKKAGKDLYNFIYAKTQVDTLGAAVQATADQFGMQVEKMRLILGGDITPILERNPLLRIEDAVKIYNGIIAVYNQKKDSIDLEATVKAKVEPSEMFADGDLDNSGFDLIKDLDNIEIILFQKADKVTFGGAYKPSSSDGSTDADKSKKSETPDLKIKPTTSSGAAGADSGGGSVDATPVCKPNPATKGKNPFAANANQSDKQFLGGINPNQCFGGDKIGEALDKFQSDLDKNAKLKNAFVPTGIDDNGLPCEIGKPPSGTDNGDKGGNGSGSGSAPKSLFVPTPPPPGSTPPVPSAPEGDWGNGGDCDKIFCMTLEFVKKAVTPAFNKTDNCIQCHIQYINDSLQKTLAHSLIPGKASGNLGESGLCKNAAGTALGMVGMNVNISLVPIVTPVKTDIQNLSLAMGIDTAAKAYASKTEADWELFKCKQDPEACTLKKQKELEAKAKGKPVNTSPSPTNQERELLISLSTAPDDASVGRVWTTAKEADDATTQSNKRNALVASLADDSFQQAGAYKALDEQMKQMNQFFFTFKQLFRTLVEDVPGLASTKACKKLNDVPMCT